MKNYYEEFEKFKREQYEMNEKRYNWYWDGWLFLYLAYKLDGDNK